MMVVDAKTAAADVAADILASIEAGTAGDWTMPWTGVASRPVNAFSGRPFRGSNLITLWAAARRLGFRRHLWASPETWRRKGGTPRADAVGARILIPVFDESAPAVPWTAADRSRLIPMLGPIGGDALGGESRPLIGYDRQTWLNCEEVAGVPLGDPVPPAPDVAAARLEAVLAAWRRNAAIKPRGPALQVGGMDAKWTPGTDRITVPPRDAFGGHAVGGYALWVQCLGHESIHATGSRGRCARDLTGKPGSTKYAREELVAELGTAFLCTAFGLSAALLEHSKAYLRAWMEFLRAPERHKAFFRAVAEAEAASAYILAAANEGAPVA